MHTHTLTEPTNNNNKEMMTTETRMMKTENDFNDNTGMQVFSFRSYFLFFRLTSFIIISIHSNDMTTLSNAPTLQY
jgi:hypothetical protein